jgi:hypothetical protein
MDAREIVQHCHDRLKHDSFKIAARIALDTGQEELFIHELKEQIDSGLGRMWRTSSVMN